MESNKPQIPVTDLMFSRYVKERHPRSVGRVGGRVGDGSGSRHSRCDGFQQPACTSLHVAVSQLQPALPLARSAGEAGMGGWRHSADRWWAGEGESSDCYV